MAAITFNTRYDTDRKFRRAVGGGTIPIFDIGKSDYYETSGAPVPGAIATRINIASAADVFAVGDVVQVVTPGKSFKGTISQIFTGWGEGYHAIFLDKNVDYTNGASYPSGEVSKSVTTVATALKSNMTKYLIIAAVIGVAGYLVWKYKGKIKKAVT